MSRILKYAAFDQDQTPASRRLLESFSGSHYFSERPPIGSMAELDQRMRSGELAVAIEIPSGFGRDLANQHPPDIAFWIDGAMPFRGETTKGYVNGLVLRYMQDLAVERFGPNPVSNVYVGRVNIENRFRYNQGFKSVFSMVPSVIVIMLVLIPAIMATIGVVREVETGSIANFRSTPISKFEFLLGKQFPYVVVGMLAFILLGADGVCGFPRPGEGVVRSARARGAALRLFDLWLRATHLDVRQDPGRGSVCNHGNHSHPHGELFRPARARVVPHRPGTADWADVSDGVVSADQRRHLHQRPGLFRSLAQCTRPCGVCHRLFHCRSHFVAETGELRCRRAREQMRENRERRLP